LAEIVTPAEFTDENLLLLVICRMVNLRACLKSGRGVMHWPLGV
jgi:hypothetical protein